MRLKNCPLEYYKNCVNAIKECKGCGAGVGKGLPLKYFPKEAELLEHPYKEQKESRVSKSQEIKASLKAEKTTVKRLIGCTLKSGSINHDGDIKLNELRLEHKVRHKSKSIGISKAEREKGYEQKLDGWVIVDAESQERYYILTEKALEYLLPSLLKKQNEVEDK